MRLVLIGFSHRTAPFDLLGKIALSPALLPEFLEDLTSDPVIAEAACVATCNRTEIYCVAASLSSARRLVLEKLARLRGLDYSRLSGHCLSMEESDATRHLLRVASGIDSLIVGELEILGQVRRAWDFAEQTGSGGIVLRNLFQRAIRMGRRVRRDTNISRGNVSIATSAVRLISDRLGGLDGRRALVIGTGKVGSQTLHALREAGVSAMMLVNRTVEKAQSLAEEMGCTPVAMEDMVDAVAKSDIIICATGAPHYVVTRSMAEKARQMEDCPRVYADLSAPPNVEPEVEAVPGAVMVRLDSLQEIAESNAELRHEEAERVEALIDREVARITHWTRSAPRQRIIRDFRNTMEEIRASHLHRHGRRYDEKTLQEIDRYSRSLVSAMLHEVTNNLNSLDANSDEGRRELELARRLLLPQDHSEPSSTE